MIKLTEWWCVFWLVVAEQGIISGDITKNWWMVQNQHGRFDSSPTLHAPLFVVPRPLPGGSSTRVISEVVIDVVCVCLHSWLLASLVG
jgi:hypothetical protein